MLNSAEELAYNKRFSKTLIGKSIVLAEKLAGQEGLVYRIVEENGRRYPASADVNVKRIGFVVRQATVIDVEVG